MEPSSSSPPPRPDSSSSEDEEAASDCSSARFQRQASSSASTSLTPLRNSEVGALFPIRRKNKEAAAAAGDSASERSLSSFMLSEEEDEDEEGVKGNYAEASSSSSGARRRLGPQFQRRPASEGGFGGAGLRGPSKAAAVANSTANHAVSREELKQTLLSVMERKEELHAQVLALRKRLEAEQESSSEQRRAAAEEKRQHEEAKAKHETRVQVLARENELLKHQGRNGRRFPATEI